MKTKILFIVIFCSILLARLTTAQQIWQQTNGPYGTYVTSLALHANGDLYAGCRDKGRFRSAIME